MAAAAPTVQLRAGRRARVGRGGGGTSVNPSSTSTSSPKPRSASSGPGLPPAARLPGCSRRPRSTNSSSVAKRSTSGSQIGIHARRSSTKSHATTRTERGRPGGRLDAGSLPASHRHRVRACSRHPCRPPSRVARGAGDDDGREAPRRADPARGRRRDRELGHVGLATVLVGDDPASDVYITLKHARRWKPGSTHATSGSRQRRPRSDVLALVADAQRGRRGRRDPRPAAAPGAHRRDAGHVRRAPAKDVDGFHPVNAGNLYLGTPLHVPATPAGCMALLAEYGIDPSGKEAVVIGRSEIVGRPVAMLLLQAHATVTICHSRTADLAARGAAGGHRRRRRGRAGDRHARDGEAGRDRASTSGSRRTEEGIRGDVDPRSRGGRRAPHADARRHRPDDDRDAPAQRRQGRSLPARRSLHTRPSDDTVFGVPHLAPARPALLSGGRSLSVETGTVKWFSNEKGFGFIARERRR